MPSVHPTKWRSQAWCFFSDSNVLCIFGSWMWSQGDFWWMCELSKRQKWQFAGQRYLHGIWEREKNKVLTTFRLCWASRSEIVCIEWVMRCDSFRVSTNQNTELRLIKKGWDCWYRFACRIYSIHPLLLIVVTNV